MTKYFLNGLVLIYIIVTALAVLWLISLFGLHFGFGTCLSIMISWILICYISIYFDAEYLIFRKLNVRKPILPEEEKTGKYLEQILVCANFNKPVRLMIAEQRSFEAFAIGHNTIVISRGLMEKFSEPEIKGVLAHELGHLNSKDCMIYTAFGTANKLAGLVSYMIGKCLWTFRRLFMGRSCVPAGMGFIMMLFAACVLYIHLHLLPTLLLILFLLTFNKIDSTFAFFWLMVSRFNEYKQDAFAHNLGFGKELQQALYKLAQEDVPDVNAFHILTKSTHPVIYNRIRRLEKLEGLRN